MDFWSPSLHYIITFVHIFSAVFWLGWIVFIFFVLRPVAVQSFAVDPTVFMGSIRRRVRKIVFWLIPVILLTGLYNMAYRGLMDWQVLTRTATGHRMLWKLGAAAVIFGIYYIVPLIMGGEHGHKQTAKDSKPDKRGKRIEVAMHLVVFLAGATAAYLGITIGG